MVRSRNRLVHDLLGQTPQQQCPRNKSEIMKRTVHRETSIEVKTWKVTHKREHLTLEPKSKRRPFSEQTQRRGLKLSNVLHARKLRKIETKLEQFEGAITGVMEAKIERNLDKKKGIDENTDVLYHQIMNRNIGNLREIQTFILKYQGSFLKQLQARKGGLLLKKRKVQSAKGVRKEPKVLNLPSIGGSTTLTLRKIAKRKFTGQKLEAKVKRA
jgi:hypothetical protein